MFSVLASILPGLNCLQRNFPCNKNAPRYSSFAIKCGGEEMKVDIIVCEADSYDLGGASCIVLDNKKLAISDAGPKLYQSSRQSSGSLRFYGLSLENGLHNVSLSFAETVFGDQGSQKWMSLGRRVFDIYIQEQVGKEKQLQTNLMLIVSENYLEIDLFWAGKETCCIPDRGSCGPLISALKCHSRFHTNCWYWTKEEEEWVDCCYAELRSATEDFDRPNKLGPRGFGPV
ncbi:hypothetical protein Pint_11486 [Pistacia integerrima]|uniref:Uncharacterized protein n=1 Tax=Pistacia integerrima TaxID=434235 RepID=A0ACC0XIN4_9ROSI|nr:hypothetical protein Pint_11486 [Pistacia integerrima]